MASSAKLVAPAWPIRGQALVQLAQQHGAIVKPLVGPNSILLALMASGMNGQQFQFVGYLPIDIGERAKAIKSLESESRQKDCTQIFIETPYRNNGLARSIDKNLPAAHIDLCCGRHLLLPPKRIQTKTVQQWKAALPNLHSGRSFFCSMHTPLVSKF